MQVVRTIVWVLLLAAFLLFTFANWDADIAVQIWDNLVWETKLPAIVVVSFLLGLLPMWLLHQGTKWRLQRRIGSLETAHRTAIANTATAHEPARPDERPVNPPLGPETPDQPKDPA